MERDLDEISKMAQALKGKIEALDKSVNLVTYFIEIANYQGIFSS